MYNTYLQFGAAPGFMRWIR